MSNPLLDRYPHPGRFEGELNLTERLDQLLGEWGGATDGVGDEGFGEYHLFTDLNTVEELGDLGGITAAILHYNEQGFVTGHYYTIADEAQAAWTVVEHDYNSFLATLDD